MNKIAQYLNEHLLGEVTCNESVLKQFSRDASVLAIMPEIVAHPRNTSDIRKIARFTWQLAEKGHIMPITARGGGTDQTGAAIGSGIIINTMSHLSNILYINSDYKKRFVHVQPGVIFRTLNDTLKTHEMILPTYPSLSAASTIGGAVANNSGGRMSGCYGLIGEYVSRMEVVLANGDIMEVTRISKIELNKKKGMQTFEGEIYRKIDGLIDDNKQLINDRISDVLDDNTGYPGIAGVKRKDGSFDLTPLFIGSQGTLGIVSEIILKIEHYQPDEPTIVAVFENATSARDSADLLINLDPLSIEVIDGEFYNTAHACGKKYLFDTNESNNNIGAVVFANFNDPSEHIRKKKFKQALKRLSKQQATIYSSEKYSVNELDAIREVSSVTMFPEAKDMSMLPVIDGASIPSDRREEFIGAVAELAKKHHVQLPLHINWLDGVIHTRPQLNLHTVSDRQKTFKLINSYIELVIKSGGNIATYSAEGRTKATAAYSQLDDEVVELYSQIRGTFDPFGTLNPGVKQKSDLKTLISQLDSDYSLANFAKYSPKN